MTCEYIASKLETLCKYKVDSVTYGSNELLYNNQKIGDNITISKMLNNTDINVVIPPFPQVGSNNITISSKDYDLSLLQ